MASITIKNFSLLNIVGLTVTATPTSARTEIDAADGDIMLVNNTTSVIFVRTGTAQVEADVNAMPILPGEKGVYSKGKTGGTTRFIAYFVEAGSADLVILQGLGS